MNTAELTALLNEDRAAQQKARLMDNITRRAARLWEVGYVATETISGLYVRAFQVLSPEGKRYSTKVSKTDALPGTFFGSRCSCPCFTDHKTCKHLIALSERVETEARDEAQCDAYDAWQAGGGFDVDEYEFANFCGEGRN